ncbi:uncharacterized protein MELLADRAFT_94500 [Melampsora larici-populina 98AG31]|uniref:Uncharacterized protein n=1 Tax=Melampsora larici-populina (strain 98AG31 / pathotype 3-4-7) TaxID=747676 RepID=F4RBM7_MELLP|nr:uncharacterized protein MELLADRAFT_94500 [Melampsora larici-populina 98AG31]EGG10307.1 hypothetical protein MELLADRAFT_94500 [Melampsora larici-populina 98AG31]
MPITGHPFHPTGTQVVANLERIAAHEASGLHTPSHTQHTSTPSQRISTNTNTTEVPSTATNKPPRKRNKTKSKKGKSNKRKRNDTGSGAETEEEPVFDPADLKNSDKTAFHEELQTMIAIKALELGTTVSDIEAVFDMLSGEYIGVRRPSRWNRFLQSPRAREVFKAARGVGSGEGMRQLSAVWKSMTEAEKDVYKEATQETDPASLQAMDEDLAELEVGAQSRNETLQSGSNTVVNPRSLKKYKDNADKYLDDIMKKFTRSTVGVTKIVEDIYAMDGFNNFATEVQAHLVGRKPGEMTKSKSVASFIAESLRPSQVIAEVTGLKHWPWSRCDLTLAEAGFKLELLPGARSVEATFRSVSSNITRAKLLALESDLENNLIRLAPLNQTTPAQPQRTANTENTENTTDTATSRVPPSDTLDSMSSETVSHS